MTSKPIQLLETVALLRDIPERRLRAGEVGTVIELLDGAFEVEFCDEHGQTYAAFALRANDILPLHNGGKAFKMNLVEA